MPNGQPSYLPNQEALLLDYVYRLDPIRKGRKAVRLHLSRLKPFNRREQHVRTAVGTFDNVVKTLSGQIFVLRNSDLFLIYKTAAEDEVEACVNKVRFLFDKDPLLAEGIKDRDADPFSTWYDANLQYDELLALVRQLMEDERRLEDQSRPSSTFKRQTEAPTRLAKDDGRPLTPVILDRVTAALEKVEVDTLIRRQNVCMVDGDTPIEVFRELFVSMADLRETLLPDVNLASSPWLFQHLTETLDRRVMVMLSRIGQRTRDGDISINVNLSTLLSKDFLAFEDSMIASMRGHVILELQKVDVFSDLAGYLFVLEFVQSRGYRVCIDGISHITMPFINREQLGADLIKLIWSPDVLKLGQGGIEGIRAMIKAADPEAVVLTRCDSREALEFGRSMGIQLFQGYFIEHLLVEENRRRAMRLSRRTSR